MTGQLIQAMFHLGQCIVWTAEASSGAVQRRKLGVGLLTDPESREMTPEEKTDHALSVARAHLDRLSEIAEYAKSVEYGDGK